MNQRQKRLSPEDRILWGRVAGMTSPLPGKELSADWFEGEEKETFANKPRIIRQAENFRSHLPSEPQAQNFPAFDRMQRRRLEKGRTQIEARIDLHGLSQAEAYNMLLSFLTRTHSAGMRHVLVITGKGTSSGSIGVLARTVPQWLTTPPFRVFVSGHDVASRKHGGEGALYIRLRRQKGLPR